MRTTIRLDQALLEEAKRRAAEAGITLTAFIEESLRERLARGRPGAQTGEPVRLHVAGKGGLQSGIDLDGTASLLDAMEARR